MTEYEIKFEQGGVNFTTELLKVLGVAETTQNIFFSPFSIQVCLALAYAGACGETANEIVKGLHYPDNSPTEIAHAFQAVLEKYKNSEIMSIANKIYIQQGKALKTEYSNTIKENYLAAIESLDFAESAASAEAINNWVNEKTSGKINDLVTSDSLNSDTRLLLLNALYFKGKWAHQFKEAQTEEDDFWTTANQSVRVQYMRQKEKFRFGIFEQLGCSALEMPYQNGDLLMLVLLPDARDGLKALVEKLQGVNILDLTEDMFKESVEVKIPKFKAEYSIDLSATLKKLGVNKMFTDGAEFSKMLESPENVFVSKVLHKANIEVNEEGTEAAAATATFVMTRMLILPSQFVADHPFLYFIYNRKNILFAGSYLNA